MRIHRGAIVGALLLTAVAVIPSTPAFAVTPVTPNQGTYYQLPPSRILDSRDGTGAPKAPLGSGATITLQVTGRGGVPAAGVSAVVLNVTATGVTAGSHVTVYPTGVERPTASSLNLVAGWTGANSVTVAVGTGGQVDVYNNNGSTEIIADVVGYYAADNSMVSQFGYGGQYQTVTPERLFDSRTDWTYGKLTAGDWVQVGVSYGAAIDPHIRALVVNVTAVDPSAAGYLATWSGSGPPPGTSTLNYTRGALVPNMAVVPTSLCCAPPGGTGVPSIAVFTQADTHVVVDILGFIDDGALAGGLRFTPQTPVRIADTRTGLGTPGSIGQGVTATITAPPAVAPAGTQALALNVTAILPDAWTYLTVWPNGVPQPYVSNLNPSPGQIVPNAVYTRVGSASDFNVYNNAGTTNLVVDVVGTFAPAVAGAGISGQQQLKPTGPQPAPLLRGIG